MNQFKKLSNADLASLKQKFVEWIANKPQKNLNILVTGKTGVGKSRLVNALVGRRVAKEGRLRDPCTDAETPYRVYIAGIEVIIWDSRGLQDGTDNDELYLANLKEINSKHGFDIVIYCIRMDDTKFYSADKEAIRKLTRGFGNDLWKKAVIALTFANKVEDPDEDDEFAYFMGEMSEWERQIDGLLTELQIDSQVRNALNVVPAGNYKKLRLPTCDNWLADLWTSCYCAMSDSAGIALYLINKHRLRCQGSAALAAAISSQSEDEEPNKSDTSQSADAGVDPGNIPREIPLNEEQENNFWAKLWRAFVGWLRGQTAISHLVDALQDAARQAYTILKEMFA